MNKENKPHIFRNFLKSKCEDDVSTNNFETLIHEIANPKKDKQHCLRLVVTLFNLVLTQFGENTDFF